MVLATDGFTSAQLEAWMLCRGVNKSSFCKSKQVKGFVQYILGKYQVLLRNTSSKLYFICSLGFAETTSQLPSVVLLVSLW